MEWEVNKGNSDGERRQLNKVLQEIEATVADLPTGTVESVDLGASTGLTPSGGPVTGSGTLTYTLSANLQGWHALDPATVTADIADAQTDATQALADAAQAASDAAQAAVDAAAAQTTANAAATELATIESGTYTPALTLTANITSALLGGAMYTRVGNTVTVSVALAITPTVAGTGVTLRLTPPIASNFVTTTDAIGTVAARDTVTPTTYLTGHIQSHAGSDSLALQFGPPTNNPYNVTFVCMYQILA